MKIQSTLMAIAALCGAVSLAHAAEGQKPERREHRGPRPAILKKFDKDGDGKLSDEEKKALQVARQARRKAVLEKYDTDKDGKLSDEERKARRQAVLEKYDTNKDGQLSRPERKAAVEAGDALPQRRKGMRHGPGQGGRRHHAP